MWIKSMNNDQNFSLVLTQSYMASEDIERSTYMVLSAWKPISHRCLGQHEDE